MKWEKVKLGDIATFSNGINFNKTAYAKGIKLIGVSNFGDRFYPDYSQLQEVKKDIVRLEDCLRNGDIVFVRSNGNKELVGRCMLVKNPTERVTYSGFCIRARLNDTDRYDPVYFTYYFKSKAFRRAVSGTAVGANIQNLSQARLSNHECRIPSIEVQHRIADILSVYDNLIENNQKQIKLLEEAAQRLYKEWFVDLCFPGHENTEIVDGVPEGWNEKTLSQVANVIMGQSPKSDFYNSEKKGLPFHQGVGSYGVRFVMDDIYSTSYTRIAEPNSILFSVRAPVGRLNITKNKVVIGRGLAAINQTDGCQSYLYYLLKNKFFKDNIVGNGSIFASVSKDELLNQKFLIPERNLMMQFEKIVSQMDKQIENLDSKNKKLIEARDRLLPKLMSGEVEV